MNDVSNPDLISTVTRRAKTVRVRTYHAALHEPGASRLTAEEIDNEPYFQAGLESLKQIPIVGDVRGAGYFWGIELVKDQSTKETWAGDDAERLLRGFVSPEMFRRGLICRSDDRGDPVVQLAPPLISTRRDIDFVVDVLGEVFTGASKLNI